MISAAAEQRLVLALWQALRSLAAILDADTNSTLHKGISCWLGEPAGGVGRFDGRVTVTTGRRVLRVPRPARPNDRGRARCAELHELRGALGHQELRIEARNLDLIPGRVDRASGMGPELVELQEPNPG